jgi:HlyD family secretion protein
MKRLLGLLRKRKLPILSCLFFIIICVLLLRKNSSSQFNMEADEIFKVKKHSFSIDVRTIGELEAAQSTSISSSIKGDNGKVIYLISDGVSVKKGEILVKLDPTPFEEKIETLKSKLKEQKAYAAALKKGLDWEKSHAERDDKTSVFEVEVAELELNKVLQGDGPLEIARLKNITQKALSKLEELKGYSSDLLELQKQGFLNPVELKHVDKKLEEEQENYEASKLQYESYINHVYPMQIKKAETTLKQALMKREESAKIRGHAIGKAMVELEQATYASAGLKLQLQEAKKELDLTEITAPGEGIVVHKEDYRNGQKRKPRLGDVLVRNQILLDLPDLNFMKVKTKVREVDLCKVNIGKKALVEIDAYPHLLFTGTIDLIGMLALPDPGKPIEEKYFEIRILLDNSDPRVRPGMTARVSINAEKLKDVLVAPTHALFHEQEKIYCYVVKPQNYEKREIKIGLENEEWVEIKDGLKEGEHICLIAPIESHS